MLEVGDLLCVVCYAAFDDGVCVFDASDASDSSDALCTACVFLFCLMP